MSFWQQRLGVTQPPAAPAPSQAPSSTRPWWLPQALVQQPQTVPQQAVQQAVQQTPLHPQQSSVSPDGKSNIVDLLNQDEYTTEKAQSARDTERCPECGSANYVAPAGMPNMMKQCFDCGANPRFTQTSSGISGVGMGKNVEPPRPSRVQVNTPPAGFPPVGSVVDHSLARG